MAQKVEAMEAEAEASAELNADMAGATLEAKFQELEADTTASEALIALKQKMGVVVAAPAPVAAAPAPAEEEFDIDALERELAEIAATVPAQARKGQ